MSALVSALAVGALLRPLVSAARPSPAWSGDAIGDASVGPLFGVRFPARPTAQRSRVQGLQALSFDLLAQLPPDGTQDFLAVNRLAPGARPNDFECDVTASSDEVRAQQGVGGAVRVTPLDGPPDPGVADGGVGDLTRAAALLEVGGRTWVHLCAESQ